jgi:hypothetical protein
MRNSDYFSHILVLALPLHGFKMLQAISDGRLCHTVLIMRYHLALR